MSDIEALTPAVAKLMREVAETIILPRFRDESLKAIDKGRGELVTIADRESEAALAKGLADILPEAAILGEEAVAADPSVMERAGADLCWIIDPLDGTGNFARGDEKFGMLIALAAKGETVGGWIYAPLTGRLCHAVKGAGAFVNGERIHNRPPEDKPVVGMSALWADKEERKAMRDKLADRYVFKDLPRCAAEVYPDIALGGLDAVLFGRTLAWDHCAGSLLVEEAGGRSRRADGQPFRADDDPAHRGLVSAVNESLWAQVNAAFA